MAFLSQASHLGSLLLPHDAFQEYAAHPAEWSAALNSKGLARLCPFTQHSRASLLDARTMRVGLLSRRSPCSPAENVAASTTRAAPTPLCPRRSRPVWRPTPLGVRVTPALCATVRPTR